MTIYSTDTYEIKSIMHRFKTEEGVSTWDRAYVYLQGLPIEDYPFIVPIILDQDGPAQEDFDDIDSFTSKVIPILEESYLATALNKKLNITYSTANSAISPISMFQNAVTV